MTGSFSAPALVLYCFVFELPREFWPTLDKRTLNCVFPSHDARSVNGAILRALFVGCCIFASAKKLLMNFAGI